MVTKLTFTFFDEQQLVDLVHGLPDTWGGLDGHLRASQNMRDADFVARNTIALHGRDLLGSEGVLTKKFYDKGDLFFEQMFENEHDFKYSERIEWFSKAELALKAVRNKELLASNIGFNSCGAGDYGTQIIENKEERRQILWREAKTLLIRALSSGYKGYFIVGTVKDEKDWFLPHDKEIPYSVELVVDQFDNTAVLAYNFEHGKKMTMANPVLSKMFELGFEIKKERKSQSRATALMLDQLGFYLIRD